MTPTQAFEGRTRFPLSLVLILLAVHAILCGCISTNKSVENPGEPASALLERKLEKLAMEDPESCLEQVADLLGTQKTGSVSASVLSEERLLALFHKGAESLESKLTDSIASADYAAARRFASSARALVLFARAAQISPDVLPSSLEAWATPETQIRLLLGHAEQYYKNVGYAAGKSLIAGVAEAPGNLIFAWIQETSPSLSGIPAPDDLTPSAAFAAWSLRAREQGDEDAALWFESLSKRQQPSSPPSNGGSQEWLSSAVQSVVTVYVDKGFRISGGYSVPDRVVGTAFQVAPGLYLTNHHVIRSEVDPEYEGYSRLSIKPSDNPAIRIPAKVVGWDEEMDLALIRSEEKARTIIHIPVAMALQPGERVYAAGSPVGLENSVNAGIVSSFGRKIISFGEAVQIDVPVNMGNSGSPLFVSSGRLAGMVFAGLQNFQNINFALPSTWIHASLP
ncbi:MAG: S1C family serine protease, partial [Rectinema sp.]|nr:S1C family serine protease [Rectinema sp.]